ALTVTDREKFISDCIGENSDWQLVLNPKILCHNQFIRLCNAHQRDVLRRTSNTEWRNDKSIVIEAVMRDGSALQFASKNLQKDKDVVMAAIQQNKWALQYASKDLQNDKDVVLTTVQQDGLALRFASKELQNDKDVVMAAVQQNKWALRFASKDLQK